MSFGWTQPGKLETWRTEGFTGYYTDIQRAARKSLPRKLDKELRGLLGISTVSTVASCQTVDTNPVPTDTTHEPQDEHPVGNEKSSFSCLPCLWCRDQDGDWSRRERSILACAVYLAVVVILLLVVVTVLATNTGSPTDNGAADASDNVRNGEETSEITTHTIPTRVIPSTISAIHTSASPTSAVIPVSAHPRTTIRTETTAVNNHSATDAQTSQKPPVSTTPSPAANATSVVPSSGLQSTMTLTNTSVTPPNAVPSTTPTSLPLLVSEPIICTTRDCVSANDTLSRVDVGVSPCTDFHTFACGGWLSRTQTEATNSSGQIDTSLVNELRSNILRQIQAMLEEEYDPAETVTLRVAKRLYQACRETNHAGDIARGLGDMHVLLDPLGMDAEAELSGSLTDVMHEAYMRFVVAPFFKTSVVPEVENGVRVYMLQLETPPLLLHTDAYEPPLETNQLASQHVIGVTDILYSYITSGGTNSTDPSSHYDRIYSKVLDAYRLEANISAILSNYTRAHPGDGYPSDMMTPGVLRMNYSNIDWDKVIGLDNIAGRVKVILPAYFERINELLMQYDNNILKLYTFLTVLTQGVLPNMAHPFRTMLNNGSDTTVVYTDQDCVEMALDLIPEDLHSLYVAHHTQTVLHNRIALDSLTNTLTTTLNSLISASGWIHDDLKTVIGVFLRNLRIQFSPVHSYLTSVTDIAVANQSFVSLAVELHRLAYTWQVTNVGSNVTDVILDWISSQVKYDHTLNSIGLPTGLTVHMTTDDPLFKLYGTVGVLVARQLVEILTVTENQAPIDESSKHGDLDNGVPPSWWGQQNTDSFRSVSDCFSGQNTTLLPQENQIQDIDDIIKMNGAIQLVIQAYMTQRPGGHRLVPGTTLPELLLLLTNAAQVGHICGCDRRNGTYGILLPERLPHSCSLIRI